MADSGTPDSFDVSRGSGKIPDNAENMTRFQDFIVPYLRAQQTEYIEPEKSFMEDISVKELMAIPDRDSETGLFLPSMDLGPLKRDSIIQGWLARYPHGTQVNYRSIMKIFLNACGNRPKDLIEMEAKELKQLAKSVAGALYNQKRPTAAKKVLPVIKSFANHYQIDVRFYPEEHIKVGRIKNHITPKPHQVYAIAEAASGTSRPVNPRNRAIVMFDWVTALRQNAICSLRCGVLKGYTENDCPIPLKVGNRFQKTGEDLWCIDSKLSGYSVDYYYTFIAKEGFLPTLEWLKWREQHLGSYKDSDPVFCVVMPGGAGNLSGTIGSQMSETSVWWMFKHALPHVGINRDSTTFHKLRSSFKSVMIAADCDEEVREVLMGHAPKGSAKNYFDYHDVEMALKEYKKADWSRAGTHRLDKLEQEYAAAMQRINELERQQAQFPMKEFFEYFRSKKGTTETE